MNQNKEKNNKKHTLTVLRKKSTEITANNLRKHQGTTGR